jgi:hypothetical protein
MPLPPTPPGPMTTSIFSDLKARILAAEADPEVDTASAAVDLLRDWLVSVWVEEEALVELGLRV